MITIVLHLLSLRPLKSFTVERFSMEIEEHKNISVSHFQAVFCLLTQLTLLLRAQKWTIESTDLRRIVKVTILRVTREDSPWSSVRYNVQAYDVCHVERHVFNPSSRARRLTDHECWNRAWYRSLLVNQQCYCRTRRCTRSHVHICMLILRTVASISPYRRKLVIGNYATL